jgi:hypothetical protein
LVNRLADVSIKELVKRLEEGLTTLKDVSEKLKVL